MHASMSTDILHNFSAGIKVESEAIESTGYSFISVFTTGARNIFATACLGGLILFQNHLQRYETLYSFILRLKG